MFMNRLSCTNGMVSEVSFRRYHIGKSAEDFQDVQEYFSDETRQLDDQALFSKVKDVCSAILSPGVFEAELNKLRAAAGVSILGRVTPAVEEISNKYQFSKAEKTGILEYLAAGGDLSQWGLANAVTRAAQDVPSFDRRVDLERRGHDIIELPQAFFAALPISMN
jgi:hypothetical protein